MVRRTAEARAVAAQETAQAEAEARAVVEAIGREFGLQLAWEAAEEPPFLMGRCARVLLGKVPVGIVGEISPDVLTRFGLENPTVMGELSVELLAGRSPRRRFVLES